MKTVFGFVYSAFSFGERNPLFDLSVHI
jgi:hypothetical protein